MIIRQPRWFPGGSPVALVLACVWSLSVIDLSGCTPAPADLPSVVPAKGTEPWSSPEYIDWLEERSMLKQSQTLAGARFREERTMAAPLRGTATAPGDSPSLGLAIGLSRVGHHKAWRVSHCDLGRAKTLGRLCGNRHFAVTYGSCESRWRNRRA